MASHNSFSFINAQKSLISNIKNVYKCLLGMLLNQFITLSVFLHSFTFISSDKVLFIFCNMCLLILPISFLGETISQCRHQKNFKLVNLTLRKARNDVLQYVIPFYFIVLLRYSVIISRLKIVV